MVQTMCALQLAVLLFFSGFGSIHLEMELIDGGGTEGSSGDCGKIRQMSQNQLDKLDVKLTFIKNKLSEYTSHIDRNINDLESNLHEIKETIRNLTNLVVPTVENNISRLDGLLNSTTEPARNVPDIIPTTEVNKQAPSKCDRSQQEKCCTAAVVGDNKFTNYTEMSARGYHTVMNITSDGLQEYTMYFAVRGERMVLLLSPTSPVNWSNLYYSIVFTDQRGGNIYMWERLPTDVSLRTIHDLYTTNIISGDQYSYYYVTISGDTLEVGRRGELPLMKHTSTDLRTLKYFSFGWTGFTAGEALYDCTAE